MRIIFFGTLRNAKLLLLEASILPYNEGAPRFSDLVTFMAAVGFELLDVAEGSRLGGEKRGKPFQVDLIFAPRTSELFRHNG